MIQKFVDHWISKKAEARSKFSEHPGSYKVVVRAVVEILSEVDASSYEDSMDPERIHVIDDGEYQGTLVYVIGASGYQPDVYWYVKVSYGTCSGCDTLQSIEYSELTDTPTEVQIDDYMTLALHIVQGIKRMGDEDYE